MLPRDNGEETIYWVDTPLFLECGRGLPTSYKKSFRFRVREGATVRSGDIILEWEYIKALGRSPVAKSPVDGTVVGLMRLMEGTVGRYYVMEIRAHPGAVDQSRDVMGNARVPRFFDDVNQAGWEIMSMGFWERTRHQLAGRMPEEGGDCEWPNVSS